MSDLSRPPPGLPVHFDHHQWTVEVPTARWIGPTELSALTLLLSLLFGLPGVAMAFIPSPAMVAVCMFCWMLLPILVGWRLRASPTEIRCGPGEITIDRAMTGSVFTAPTHRVRVTGLGMHLRVDGAGDTIDLMVLKRPIHAHWLRRALEAQINGAIAEHADPEAAPDALKHLLRREDKNTAR